MPVLSFYFGGSARLGLYVFPILSIIAAPSVCKALLLAPFCPEKHSLLEFGSINAVHVIMES